MMFILSNFKALFVSLCLPQASLPLSYKVLSLVTLKTNTNGFLWKVPPKNQSVLVNNILSK